MADEETFYFADPLDCVPSPSNFACWHSDELPKLPLFSGERVTPMPLPGLALIAWKLLTPLFWADLLSENDLIKPALELARSKVQHRAVREDWTSSWTHNGDRILYGTSLKEVEHYDDLEKELLGLRGTLFTADFHYDSLNTKTYHYCEKGVHCGLFQAQHKALDEMMKLARPLIDSALQQLPADLTKIVTEYYAPLHLRCVYSCPYLPIERRYAEGPNPIITLPAFQSDVRTYADVALGDPNFHLQYRERHEERLRRHFKSTQSNE